ncbi:MAG: 50S ribosomal protein L18 [Deltaproteobacteria bacterium]|nr:50S ribosomal protein L18 [Deltaproteobacteria bacterium]
MSSKKFEGRLRRKFRVRKKIYGTQERPRMTIFRSLKHLYVQIVDDSEGKTLASASTQEKNSSINGSNVEGAKKLGKLIAEKAIASNVKSVVFDRNGYIYHGRVKAIADAAREGGLEF